MEDTNKACRHEHACSPLDPALKETLEQVANTIRGLSMDAVQKADSGHPGLPMGCAEIGAYLYGNLMRYNPKNPKWLNRDRFILSAGHGSMLLYSCLHLSGYDLTMHDIEQFRQLHSRTPGHPEDTLTPGVETATGPLGQGVGNAVGQALGLKLLATKFNTSENKIIDNKVYCLMGDGCMMEGISSEASSFAGHLGLDNLVLIYDSNNICLDGPLFECSSENTKKRYEAYNWEVLEVDGNDLDALHKAFEHIKKHQTKPILLIAHTLIGKGSPNKAGTHNAHGAPLGVDEVKASKEALGIPQEAFYVPQSVRDFFKEKLGKDLKLEEDWRKDFDAWAKANPAKLEEFEKMAHHKIPEDIEAILAAINMSASISGRKASQAVLDTLMPLLPQLYGGSADLSGSDCTMVKQFGIVTPGHFEGRNIKFGVREFAMAAMANGLNETDLITPYIGTFLTFSDYMRNAIRLCCLMERKVVYQFTHDSIFLGEDGPTHQPIEQYASLRAIPHLHVIRPADANEVRGAWLAALGYKGPTALLLSRQNLPTLEGTKRSFADGVGRGAYILKKEKDGIPDYTLFATGSEVSLAMDVAASLEKMGKRVRVVSMPCWELFEKQPSEYKEDVVGGNLGKRVSIEAGVDLGWHKYIGREGIAICMEGFGASAPQAALAEFFGFTVDHILSRIL